MSEASKQIFWLDDGNAWIEGKETWVDLGYVPTRYTSAEFEFCICGPTTRYRNSGQPIGFTTDLVGTPDVILGHMGSSDSNDWRMMNTMQKGWYFDAGNSRVQTTGDLAARNIWYHCNIGPDCKLEVDSVVQQQTSFSGSLANSTIKLFSESPTCTSTNTSGDYAWLGFRYVKIFENDVLKMDLVPAKADGKACFFDKFDGSTYFGLNKDLTYHAKDLS